MFLETKLQTKMYNQKYLDVLTRKLFFFDEGDENQLEHERQKANEVTAIDSKPKKCVWKDSDDEDITVSLNSSSKLRKLRAVEDEIELSGREYTARLRQQFERTYPVPIWALEPAKKDSKQMSKLSAETDGSDTDTTSDSDDDRSRMIIDPFRELFAQSEGYSGATKAGPLKPGTIDIRKLQDANQANPSHSAVQSLSYHPSRPFLLTGGYDRTLRLFAIDGKVNPTVLSAHFRSMRIQTSQFTPDGTKVFVGGRRRYLYIWTLESGKVDKISRMYGQENTQKSMEQFTISPRGDYLALVGRSGWVNIISASTGQWLFGVQTEYDVVDCVWGTDDAEMLYILSVNGVVSEYSCVEKKITHIWRDEGAITSTKIAVGGPGDKWIALGSKSGIVNLYKHASDMRNPEPKPFKIITSLTTSISQLVFNSTGELLVIASRAKKDALRLIHSSTGSVYSNWPTNRTKLGRIGAVAISPRSELLSVGDERGRVGLWNIQHYSS